MAQRLADEELAGAILSVGFTGQDAENAVAISMAETGGTNNPTIRNSLGYVGIFQFGSFNGRSSVTKSNKKGKAVTVSLACAENPLCAAGKAFVVSDGGADWSQWDTWRFGSYVPYLGRAKTAVAAAKKNSGVGSSGVGGYVSGAVTSGIESGANSLPVIGPITSLLGGLSGGNPLNPVAAAIGGVGDVLAAISNFIQALFSAELWKRIGGLFLGVLMMGFGGYLLAKGAT